MPEFVDEKYNSVKITEGVLLIGDSVTRGSSEVLYPLLNFVTDEAWRFDAETSRNMNMGVDVINEYKNKSEDSWDALKNYKCIVVSLATNTTAGTITSAEKIVEIIGSEHQIIFVTGYAYDTTETVAEKLRTFPEKYSNVTIADWGKAIAPYSNQLAADGIHPRTTFSRKIYVECIVDAIIQAENNN